MSNFVFDKENPELIAVLEAVAVEKGLKKDIINKAIESALEVAVSEYFKELYSIAVKIKSNGAVSAFKKMTVVESVENSYREITLPEAQKIDAEVVLGTEVLIPIEVAGFSSNIIRNIGFLINKEIIKREKEVEYTHFQKLKGFIISGVVKKIYPGGLLMVLDKYEAFLSKNQMLPTEFDRVRAGERLEALVYDVEKSDTKPQALLTRTADEFLFEILKQSISEIADETIQVKSIARDPGSRSKIAVFSKDPTINPVLLCISTYGRKIRSISKELCGEQIDIVEWNEDPAVFMMNALRNKLGEERKPREDGEKNYAKPINVVNIMVDYEAKNIDAVVKDEDISFAIGRRGQNVRLLTKLLGWSIHFITKEESSQKKFEDIGKKANNLMADLNIDEMIAQLLVIEGLDEVEKISSASLEQIASIEGFDEEIAGIIKDRASSHLAEKTAEKEKKQGEITKKAEKLSKEVGISIQVATAFVSSGIESKSTLAELSVDEVVEDYKVNSIDVELISKAIMKARDL